MLKRNEKNQPVKISLTNFYDFENLVQERSYHDTASASQSAQNQTNYLVRAEAASNVTRLELKEQKSLIIKPSQGKIDRLLRRENIGYPQPCFQDIYNLPANDFVSRKTTFSKDEQLAIFNHKQEKERKLQHVLTTQILNSPKILSDQKLPSTLTEKFNSLLDFISNDATPEQRREIAKALGLSETHTQKFNNAKEFISNGIKPNEVRELKLLLKSKAKEFDETPETAIPNIRLDVIKQKGKKDRIVEQVKTTFGSTTHTLTETELENLDISNYDSVSVAALEHPKIRDLGVNPK